MAVAIATETPSKRKAGGHSVQKNEAAGYRYKKTDDGQTGYFHFTSDRRTARR